MLVGANRQAKLSDYGLSTLRANAKSRSSGLRWRAPECLLQRPTVASDVYSLGMCIYEAEAGEPPFALLDDHKCHNLRHGMVLNRPSSTSDDAWELVQSMTDADPGKRVSLEHVIAQLKRLAADETAIDAHAAAQAATTCSICSSEMAIDSRFCSQCGTRVDNERNSASLSSNPQSSRVDMRVDTPVPELLDAVRRGSSSDQEQALVLLLEKYLRGILLTLIDSSFLTAELEVLEESVRDATSDECTFLMNDLRYGLEEEKLKAIMYCAGIAGAKATKTLPNSGIFALLVDMLTEGNKRLTVWTVDAIGNLADNDDARVVIANEGAVTPLIELLHAGSNAEKGLAAYALGRLACDSKTNSLAFEAGGAISYLVELLVAGTNVEKTFAPYTLTCLAASWISIDKEEATLGWSSESEADAWIIVKQGAVPLLVASVQSSTDELKASASATLSSLATIDSICPVLTEEGVIAPLIKLLRTGNEEQKGNATSALANVAVTSSSYCEESMEEGGLDPRGYSRAVEKLGVGPLLVNMLHDGNLELKEHAAYALERLTKTGDATLTAMTKDS
ncbi:hypothetical protein PC110_g1946 [Phytophthora cactorum]|uniref:Protein kinase domain-containing protein n=1 Tax=Phytophthora cactorum TaxID=29920 RepID=A0A329SXF7_9STRA|nr:hypothetical protein PC110_g1946 [Phytophthora cactorum]